MILAATNFVVFRGNPALGRCVLRPQGGAGDLPGAIFALAGLGTIPILDLCPSADAGPHGRVAVFWLASHTVYRLQVVGRENIPEGEGP